MPEHVTGFQTEEGIKKYDACVSLTGADETNLVVAMFAWSCGVKTIITKVISPSYAEILHGVSIDCTVSPSLTAAEKLLKYVLKVKLAAPAPALCKGHCDSVTVVNLSELICVGGVNYVTAKNSGEGVTSEHCALAGTATGDNEVACAGVKKSCSKNSYLNVGELLLILCRIHAIVMYLVTEGLYYLFKSIADKSVFSRLAVFIDKCNFHFIIPFRVFMFVLLYFTE